MTDPAQHPEPDRELLGALIDLEDATADATALLLAAKLPIAGGSLAGGMKGILDQARKAHDNVRHLRAMLCVEVGTVDGVLGDIDEAFDRMNDAAYRCTAKAEAWIDDNPRLRPLLALFAGFAATADAQGAVWKASRDANAEALESVDLGGGE